MNKEYNHKVNDYQKNISSTIFSPGLTMDKGKKTHHTPGKYNRRIGGHRQSINHAQNMKSYDPLRPNAFQLSKQKKANRSNRPKSNKTYRSAHSFSKKLGQEKRRRQKLEREAQEIKDTLSNFYKQK
mmetsp:Transcript_22654/g.20133  ORF Transcript_22654/g.20133 Transcript_22654/m.20133 type:complete len:127 (+) Transcript_22654:198-578(+)